MADYNPMAMRVVEDRYVLLHSGYGGGQYIGEVREIIAPARGFPTLRFKGEVYRYQPKGSTWGTDKLDDDVLFWHRLPEPENLKLGLKPRDNLHVLPDEPDLEWFIKNNRPVNPTRKDHIHRLTGTRSPAIHIFGTDKVKMVR